MEAQHWVVVGLRAAARGPGSPGVLVLTLPVTHRPNLWCLGVAGSRRDRLLLPAPAMGFLWSCYHQSWHLNRAVTWQPHALPHSLASGLLLGAQGSQEAQYTAPQLKDLQ